MGTRTPYLTKTEAKALPKDLRDNYETHRVLGNGNATVQARKADADNDGSLTATAARTLPKDVRDNFANDVTWC